ncbi:MAG: beta-propeller repeat-containing protein [Verrucomicrobiales bacterium]|nr:beta-propeller repeat-containing protein [Verrucomicrobiales bacterium]
MNPNKNLSVVSGLVAATLLLPCATLLAADYHSVAEIPVGGAGGFDYLTVDAANRHLFVSHGTKVVVIDIEKNKVIGEVTDTPGVHGIAIAPALKKGFTTNGREAKASIFDLNTFKTLSKVETGANPDALLFEASLNEVYTFNGRGQSATVFDADSGKVKATIPLSGKPETGVADSKAGRIYLNLENKNVVTVIDTKTRKVVTDWPIAPGEEASGMAIDLEHHRLFIGAHNKLMIMMDSETGKVVGSVPIGEDVDANAFDPESQLAFASNADGTVTIAHEDSPGKLTVVQTLKTQKGAKTMALDPKTHNIYLAAGSGDNFKVYVYGK